MPRVMIGSASRSSVPPFSHALIAVDGLGHDRREDQQRHAVADAALGHELAHPHEQRGARGERATISRKRPTVRSGSRSLAPIAEPLWNRNT